MQDNIDTTNIITKTNLGVVPTTSDEMDTRRRNTAVIDYLTKLDEAKEWVSQYVGQTLDLATFLDKLPLGEWLAEMVNVFDKKMNAKVHYATNKEYMHTDNINVFLSYLKRVKLSRHFYFEVIDLYESKNIPKVVYCLHGLAAFLSRRGMAKGIEKRHDLQFSLEDEALIQGDIKNIESHKFEEINNNMDSDESRIELNKSVYNIYNSGSVNGSNTDFDSIVNGSNTDFDSINGSIINDTESINDSNADYDSINNIYDPINTSPIQCFARTYLWHTAFKGLIYKGKVSVSALRRFVSFDLQAEAKEMQLNKLQSKVIEQFKKNYKMQVEKDSILRTVRLLLENQSKLREIEIQSFPLANDYRVFKIVLYNLLHDYGLLHSILSKGYELPLRIFFPDSTVGDYHFSKFIMHNMHSEFREGTMLLASQHFRTSRAYLSLSALFDNISMNSNLCKIDLNNLCINPSDVYAELYGKKVILDEAIKDKAVRDEIVIRSMNLIEYLTARINYIKDMDLPFYVKLFVNDPSFFELFFEPAIIKSGFVSELIKYMFYSKTHALGQKIFNSDSTDFDFSDYSPIREFLDKDKSIYKTFCNKHTLDCTANEYFISTTQDNETIQVNISLQEVNSIIIILKENTKLMDIIMRNMVNEMVLLRQQPSHEFKREIKCSIKNYTENVGIYIEGDLEAVLIHSEEKKDPIKNIIVDMSSQEYTKERFILKLDTQFIDLNDDNSTALDTLLSSLKLRIILLISISNKNDFISILNTNTQEEYAKLNYPGESLDSIKQRVSSDLDFLESKNIVSKKNSYYNILEMIAADIIKSKYKKDDIEINMNAETLDALFKKSMLLKRELELLYSYLSALSKNMVRNKSGLIFNRQHTEKSVYGTYKYKLNILKPVMFENISSAPLEFIISMKECLVFSIDIICKNTTITGLANIRVDELLRLREDGITSFDVNDVCSLNVDSLIQVINEQYINY